MITSDIPVTSRRDEIVAAAMRAFACGGYAGTTMADIAREAKVSQPRISQVFGGKESAFVAAHQMAAQVVLGQLRRGATTPFDPMVMGAGYLELMRNRREVLMVLMQGFAAAPGAKLIGSEVRRVMGEIVEIIVNEAGGTYEQARDVIERGFAIHTFLAADVFGHLGDSPHFEPLVATFTFP